MKKLNINNLKYQLVITLLFIFSSLPVLGQTLTISSNGQTGTSGTNWSSSGTNPVTITATGDSNINASVVVGYLNAGISVIINSNSNLLIANNIVSTSANSSSLTFKVNSRISQAAGVTVSTNGGNITYWSDSDNNGSGVIEFSLQGNIGPATISSNGGNITLAGGIDSGGNPGGYTSQIFSRGHFTANSNGGNILFKSIASASFTSTYFASADFNAGSGSITIDAQQTGSTVALFFAGAVNMTSTKNSGTAISLTGTANSSYGVLFNSGAAAVSTIKSTAGGDITINGSSLNPSSGSIAGIYLFADILSGSGAITINGGATGIVMSSSGVSVLGQKAGQVNASNSNISVFADRIDATATTTGLSLVSSGTGSITPSGASFSSTLDTARLTFGSILSGLTLGKSTNTQAITLSEATSIAGPISLIGGNLTLNAGLTATDTNTITLQGSGNVTDGTSGFVNATNLRLTGGNVTLNSASNDVSTIAASGVSNLTYVDSNALTVGVVTVTGISSTGAVSLTGSNITLNTGLTTADTITGDISLNASTVNGSGNIALASGRALSVNQSGNSTYSGIVSGTDSTLSKLGAGTLTLSGVSSYTGATSITSGGLVFSNNTRPSTTGFTGAGQLTIEPSTSFGTDFNTNSYTYASTLTGLTFGKSGNTRTINVGSPITISGPIFMEGGQININANVNSTAAAGHLTLKSTGFINQADNVAVTTQGGNQIYWVDSDSNNSGTIVFLGTSTLQSNGGHITLAGGADSGSGTLAGGAYQLRSEGALTINTGGGDLRMKSVIDQGFSGMTFANAVNLNSGTGSISIDVQQTGTARGLTFNGPTSIISSKISGSAIAITASSAASYGLVFETLGATPHPMVIKSTAGGSIDITATGGSTSTPLFMDNVSVLSSSGDININGGTSGILIRNNSQSTTRIGAQTGEQASSSSKVTITGGLLSLSSSSNLAFDTTGQVIIQPSATSFTSPLNTSRVTFGSGITDLTIGKVGNTMAITIGSPVAVSGPVSLFGGALAINSALTATNNTINLNASSSVTQSAALTANNLSLNGTGSFTLNNTANNITTIAGGTSAMKLGSVSFTDASGGLNIGTVGANSGLTATGTILAESLIGDVTLAQNITTDNTTSNAVVVNAGKSSAIGTTTGGNILISGTPTITMGTGGIAKLYSGSEAASTGLTTLVGGLPKTRFSADEGTTTFSPVLAAGNSYAIYRSTVPASPTNLVATAGNAQISIAFTAGADGGGSITNYEYTIDGGTTWIAASPAITSSPLVITGLTNYTVYTVQIRAVNNAGAGTASASVSATPTPPTITSFTPTSGLIGSTVTLIGTNFIGVTGVTFNGTAATSFTVNNATSITATVPTGATTGAITVTTSVGTASSTSNYTVAGQILIEYPFDNTLNPSIGVGAAIIASPGSLGTTATLNATTICTDNVSSTGSLQSASTNFNLAAFQADLDFSLPVLPSSTSYLLNLSTNARTFGVQVSSTGRLNVYYATPTANDLSTQSTNLQLTAGTNYSLSLQYVSNSIRLKVDGNLVLVVDVPGGIATPSNRIFMFGDAPSTSSSISLCIDNFRVISNPQQFVFADQLLVSPSSFAAFNSCINNPSAAQTFTVSGSNLSDNSVVVRRPSSNYEISLDGTNYSNATITLTAVSGTLNATTLYVRSISSSTAGAIASFPPKVLNIDVSNLTYPTYRQTLPLVGTVYNVPTISGSNSVAIGSTITLTGSATAHGSVPWSSSNTAIATVSSSGVVTGVAGGQTVITYMNTNGCTVTQTIIVPSSVVYANSASGNDISGSGTQASPVKSFHKAYQIVQTGGTINLSGTFNWADAIESGDATTDGYTINKSITITGEGSDQTIIQSASAANSADRRIFTITSGTVSINNLTMRYGKVSVDGGALLNSSGVVTLNHCRITSNSAGSAGGVKHDAVNTFTANGCTFDSNSAGSGGAFANGDVTYQNKKFNFTNCTFFNNSSTSTVATVGGGALWVLDGTNSTITNCTFSNNKLAVGTGIGASILVRYGSVRIKNSIFVNGKEGTSNLGSSESEIDFSGGSATDEGFNIIGKQYANLSSPQTTSHFDSYATTSAADGIFTKYNSSPAQNCNLSISNTLALNGATNGTYTLETLGVSLNNGSNIANNGVSIPTVDQRGVSRINQTDIGSYESNSTAPVVTVSATSLNAFSTCQGASSTEQSFTVSGTDLTENITITAPTGYLISTTSSSGFTISLTLTQNAGNVNSTTIYVRLEGTSTGSPAGNVSVGCLCTNTQDVAVTGTVNAVTVISAHPSTTVQSVCQGTSLSALNVTATGSSLTYQWYSNTNASTSGSNLINGATSSSYTPVNSSPSALFYYCIVTGTCGTVTSNLSGLITISATPVAGTASATATTFCSGNSTTLSLAGYTGSIQWQQSSTINGTYTNISGATAASYISPALTDNTFYRALVSSGVCTAVTSNVITITVASVPDPPTFAAATIQSFTTLGSSNWTAPVGVINVEYLVVGGGGGGGNGYDNAGGGGGGAGMVLAGTLAVTEGTVYPITIGDGGVGGVNSANPSGSVGQNTIFGSKTAFGGGNGLGSRTGGIAGIAQNSNSSATGGSGSGANNGGKGGGGALGNGTNNSGATGGTGGTGISSSITGTATTYGIGGNGGNNASPATPGVPGTSNRGNGGRGATATGSSSAAGGKGGSGIVILKYFSHSSAVSYCQGATAIALTATATTGNTLQWYTVPTGGTATTTAPTPSTTISGTTIYYVSQKNDVSGCESARATISVTISATNTWTGATNNLWNEASNWSCGVVPNSSNDIVISSGTPTLNTNLTIPVGKSLTISGTGALIIAPGKILTIAGSADFGGKAVIFQSDATGSGLFGPLTGTVTGANNIQVERYIPAKRAFRFLSPSVTTTTSIKQNWQENAGSTAGLGTHITGTGGATNGFDVTATNNPSLFTFDNGSWSAVTNTNVNVLTAGTPYRLMVRGDRTTDLTTNNPTATATTLRATGTLKTGNFTPTLNQSADGFSLIGNPYQAPIDIKAILTASTNMSTNVVYYWDPTLNARGGYVTRDLTTDVNDVTSSFNQYVQPGQAVFVKKDNTANVPTMTITEANKSVANAAAGVFRNSNTSTDFGLLRVNLQANNQTIEGVLALFNAEYTWNVTSEDATKMSNLDEEVSFVQNNTNLAIALQSNPSATSELPIKIDKMRHTNYQWQFELNNYSGATPYLFDTLNNSYTQINNGTVVPFTVDSTTTNRFKIVFQNGVLSNATFDNELAIYPNPAKSGASFYVDGITEATVTVYNLLGQNVPVQTKSQGTTLQVTPNTNLSQGVYLVNITKDDTTKQVKWIVE